MDSVNMDQSEMYRNFMKWTEIYHRASEFQPSPAETLSGQDVEVEPATRHPATYCMPVPSGRVWDTWDPCVVCKGKHPLWRCVVFKAKTPTQRAKIVRNNGMCSRCINGKHSTRLCRKEITCSHPGCSHPGSHNVLLHGAERVCGACGDSQHDRKDCPLKAKKCDSCGRKEKCPDETTAECPAIDAECRTCGGKGHFSRCCPQNLQLPIPMQPFPHLDPWDPRVQLQYTLDRLEDEKKMDNMLPSFVVQEL